MTTASGRLLLDVLGTLDAEDLTAIRKVLGLDDAGDDGYLTASQAAGYISSTRSAVYQKVRSGKLRAYRQGRSVRFKRTDLDTAFTPDRTTYRSLP